MQNKVSIYILMNANLRNIQLLKVLLLNYVLNSKPTWESDILSILKQISVCSMFNKQAYVAYKSCLITYISSC